MKTIIKHTQGVFKRLSQNLDSLNYRNLLDTPRLLRELTSLEGAKTKECVWIQK